MLIRSLLYPDNILYRIRRHHTKSTYKYNDKIPKFAFLCGRGAKPDDKNSNRLLTKEYIKRYSGNNIHVLFAEELWPANTIDLLTYEHYLAEISDLIILFLESIGTAAEFGAFSMIDNLTKKMFVLIDEKYMNRNSFINNGPVKKIISTTKSSNVIYCDLNSIFESRPFLEKLNSLIKENKTCYLNLDYEKVKISSF